MNKNKTLVLGASLNPERYSNKAIHKLKIYNKQVYALGLREGVVAGVTIVVEKENYDDVDTVTLYLNPQRQETFYNYILSLAPNRVLFNPGTENPVFQKILKENNIYFEEACTLVLLSTDQYEPHKGQKPI